MNETSIKLKLMTARLAKESERDAQHRGLEVSEKQQQRTNLL